MKVCTACDKNLPQESFDPEQWLMDQHERLCKECVDSDRVARPNAESSNGFEGQGVPDHCYLCHGEGLDDSGQPLRRDCSCRNGTGHAHLSCLVDYAKHRASNEGDFMPWLKCANCLQRYQGELDVDLATERVAFCSQKYPDNKIFLLEAMHQQLTAVYQYKGPKEAEDIARRMIAMIERAKSESTSTSLTSKKLLIIEAHVHRTLGLIAMNKGAKDDAKAAANHFETSHDISDALGDDFSFWKAEIECLFCSAKDRCGEGNTSIEERLEMEQKFYEKCVTHKSYGQESVTTIHQGLSVAECLNRAQRWEDAKALLTNLATICRRVHGPNHSITKCVEKSLKALKLELKPPTRTVGTQCSGKIKTGGPTKSE